jgi:hypothetical protein
MACHVVDAAFWSLELGAPTSAEATAEGTTRESAPAWQIIHYKFPERQPKPDSRWKLSRTLPAVTLTWYDSGKKPPQELGDGKKLSSSGTIFVGEKGRLYSPSEYGMRHILLPREEFADYKEPDPYLPRNPRSQNAPYIEWIAGCKGGPMSLSNFEYASRLTEAMLVGVLAVRLGKKIEWNSDKMQAINAPEAAPIVKREYRRGWTV